MTEIILRVISALLICFSCAIIVAAFLPALKKKQARDEAKAKAAQTVQLNKQLTVAFAVLMVFVNVIGVLIIAFPAAVEEFLELNFTVTVLVWWLFTLFDDCVAFFLFDKAVYDDEKIVVKRIFRKPKTYYLKDITYFSPAGNLKIFTANESFVLFNAFSGVNNLRKFLVEKLNKNEFTNF